MHRESHPFREYLPKGANPLIVGSFPPIKLTTKNRSEEHTSELQSRETISYAVFCLKKKKKKKQKKRNTNSNNIDYRQSESA